MIPCVVENGRQSEQLEEKMEENRIDKQFDFFREIDKEKFIGRQTYLSDGTRKENDAEHAWHMAVMAILLSEYANEKIDVLRTVAMLLVHDLVEIDAGDTYAYDEEGNKTKEAREAKAADRIYGILPEDQGKKLRDLWEEFEENKTAEARFAHAMDSVQPMMLNAASNGKSWEEHGVRFAQAKKRNERAREGSEALWEYAYENFLLPGLEKGKLKKED